MEYRRSLAASFLYRFFVDIALQLEAEGSGYKAADWLPVGHESAAVHFERPASQGVQYFNKVGEQDVVGAPVRHMAADLQACHLSSSLLDAVPLLLLLAHSLLPCGSILSLRGGISALRQQALGATKEGQRHAHWSVMGVHGEFIGCCFCRCR